MWFMPSGCLSLSVQETSTWSKNASASSYKGIHLSIYRAQHKRVGVITYRSELRADMRQGSDKIKHRIIDLIPKLASPIELLHRTCKQNVAASTIQMTPFPSTGSPLAWKPVIYLLLRLQLTPTCEPKRDAICPLVIEWTKERGEDHLSDLRWKEEKGE